MHILKQNIFFVTGSLRTITNELSNMPKLMQIKLVPGKKLCRMCQAKVNNFDGDLTRKVNWGGGDTLKLIKIIQACTIRRTFLSKIMEFTLCLPMQDNWRRGNILILINFKQTPIIS